MRHLLALLVIMSASVAWAQEGDEPAPDPAPAAEAEADGADAAAATDGDADAAGDAANANANAEAGAGAGDDGAAEGDIAPGKRAAILRFMELSKTEERFATGLKAGLQFGFDPKNNPGLAQVPPAKLERIKKAVAALLEERFNWEQVREQYVQLYAEFYELDQLERINELLTDDDLQHMLRSEIDLIPGAMTISSSMMQDLQPEIMRLTIRIMQEPN